MRLLVVGREGQLARSLLAAAPPPGMTVVAIGRPELDLARPSTVEAALARHAPDVIVNAAAYTAVDKAESEPDVAFAVNAVGAEAVARAAAGLGAPVVHISTDYVFDGRKPVPYVETDPVAPLGVYGRSKLEGEQRVAAVNPRHVILRTAWVVSPYGNNFVKTMLRLAASRPEIGVVDDQHGCPTYAPHLADAILSIALRLPAAGPEHFGNFHAVGSGATTWCGLARETFRASARLAGPVAAVRAIATAEYPTPARRPANSRLDCARLRAAYGVALPDWHAGLEACVTALLTPARGTTGAGG